jgi:hypothetical protein
LRLLDPQEAASRHLSFLAYQLVVPQDKVSRGEAGEARARGGGGVVTEEQEAAARGGGGVGGKGVVKAAWPLGGSQ